MVDIFRPQYQMRTQGLQHSPSTCKVSSPQPLHHESDALTTLLSLAYAAMAQPLHRGIRCCVEGSETTFELVYRAAVDDVRHGLGGSTDAQWVVGITPLMETGCTSASA